MGFYKLTLTDEDGILLDQWKINTEYPKDQEALAAGEEPDEQSDDDFYVIPDDTAAGWKSEMRDIGERVYNRVLYLAEKEKEDPVGTIGGYNPVEEHSGQPEIDLKRHKIDIGPYEVVQRLKKMFPDISGIQDGEAWGAGKHSVHLGDCAEGGTIDGLPACDYYAGSMDPEEKIYVLGVHRKLRDAVESMGYYVECWDPGTFIAYPD